MRQFVRADRGRTICGVGEGTDEYLYRESDHSDIKFGGGDVLPFVNQRETRDAH